MAHTDACKIQVCKFMERLVENGLSLRAASLETQKESDGIPANTIRRWWNEIRKETEIEIEKERINNDPPNPTPSNRKESENNQVDDPLSRATPVVGAHGGSRPNAGPKIKYEKKEIKFVSEAMDLAYIAVVNLQRIRDDDEKKLEAFDYVINWINEQKGEIQ